MLLTLRLHLANGGDRLVSRELDNADEPPSEMLKRFSENGRIAVGDREHVPLDEIVSIEVVPDPEPQTAPPWGPGLHDEDVASALKERYTPES